MTDRERPKMATDDMLEYLDTLRESGATNTFGAGSYVQEEFGLSRRDAKAVVTYWMQTFGERSNDD